MHTILLPMPLNQNIFFNQFETLNSVAAIYLYYDDGIYKSPRIYQCKPFRTYTAAVDAYGTHSQSPVYASQAPYHRHFGFKSRYAYCIHIQHLSYSLLQRVIDAPAVNCFKMHPQQTCNLIRLTANSLCQSHQCYMMQG